MITVYFGSPGSGKTTMAVRDILKQQKRYNFTFANFGCKCADFDDVSLDGLGEWTFPKGSYIAIDEAGIEYNNRKFKSLSQDTIKWFKLHRHYCCDISVWSQSWEDMDVTLRRLSDRLYYIKKMGPFTMIRRVYKRVTVNKETEQIIDGYKMVHMLYLILKPLYYASYLLLGLVSCSTLFSRSSMRLSSFFAHRITNISIRTSRLICRCLLIYRWHAETIRISLVVSS